MVYRRLRVIFPTYYIQLSKCMFMYTNKWCFLPMFHIILNILWCTQLKTHISYRDTLRAHFHVPEKSARTTKMTKIRPPSTWKWVLPYKTRTNNQHNCRGKSKLRRGTWPPLYNGTHESIFIRIGNETVPQNLLVWTQDCYISHKIVFILTYPYRPFKPCLKHSWFLNFPFIFLKSQQDIKFSSHSHGTSKTDKCKDNHIPTYMVKNNSLSLLPPPPSPNESVWPTKCLKILATHESPPKK